MLSRPTPFVAIVAKPGDETAMSPALPLSSKQAMYRVGTLYDEAGVYLSFGVSSIKPWSYRHPWISAPDIHAMTLLTDRTIVTNCQGSQGIMVKLLVMAVVDPVCFKAHMLKRSISRQPIQMTWVRRFLCPMGRCWTMIMTQTPPPLDGCRKAFRSVSLLMWWALWKRQARPASLDEFVYNHTSKRTDQIHSRKHSEQCCDWVSSDLVNLHREMGLDQRIKSCSR